MRGLESLQADVARMTGMISVLITPPSAVVAGEVSALRPEWNLIRLGEAPPAGPFAQPLWAFVDWLCPAMSGLEMCRRLREDNATRRAHLTMVLEEDDTDARRRALNAGADDYLVGELDAARLIARIEGSAASEAAARRVLTNGPISVNLLARQVRIGGEVIPLAPNEFDLLAHFMENLDHAYSRTALIAAMGKRLDDERTVDVWITRVRRALAKHGVQHLLRTVRAVGYVLDSA